MAMVWRTNQQTRVIWRKTKSQVIYSKKLLPTSIFYVDALHALPLVPWPNRRFGPLTSERGSPDPIPGSLQIHALSTAIGRNHTRISPLMPLFVCLSSHHLFFHTIKSPSSLEVPPSTNSVNPPQHISRPLRLHLPSVGSASSTIGRSDQIAHTLRPTPEQAERLLRNIDR